MTVYGKTGVQRHPMLSFRPIPSGGRKAEDCLRHPGGALFCQGGGILVSYVAGEELWLTPGSLDNPILIYLFIKQ
jgi:hypothetical protein